MTSQPGAERSYGAYSSIERVWDACDRAGLQPDKSRGATEFFAFNPSAAERTRSFHVTWRDGKTALYLFSDPSADAADLADAIGLRMSDLFDEPLPDRREWKGRSPRQRKGGKTRGKLGPLPKSILPRPEEIPDDAEWARTAVYDYADTAGTVIQQVWRLETIAAGTRHKKFTQRFFNAQGREVKRAPKDFSPVWYRQRETLDAVHSGRPLWLLEGEKDVENALTVGLLATTNAGGAVNLSDRLLEQLAGANLHVCCDMDAAGFRRGIRVHEKLTELDTVPALYLPRLDEKGGDFTDHLDSGLGVSELTRVPVDELHLRVALTRLRTAFEEINGQLAASRSAHDNEDDEAAEKHRRYAVRWAKETQVIFEPAKDRTTVFLTRADKSDLEWVQEAAGRVRALFSDAEDLTRDAHAATNTPGPVYLQQGSVTIPAADGQQQVVPLADDDLPLVPVTTLPTPRAEAQVGGKSYAYIGGEIVRWTGRDDDSDPKYTTILNLDVRLVALEKATDDVVDDQEFLNLTLGEDTPTRSETGQHSDKVKELPEAPHVVLAYTDPRTRNVEMVRVRREDAMDSSWLDKLTIPGLAYSTSKIARAEIWDAIQALGIHSAENTVYRSTGWRRLPGHGWTYIHADGGISAGGAVPVPVHLTGVVDRYRLPTPDTAPEVLREAFFTSSGGAFLAALPDRIAVPLAGQAWSAVFGSNPWSLLLVGTKGSYKTALAALTMHHLGETWDRHRPTTSMSGLGDTTNALRIKLAKARHCLSFLDDVAPTQGWDKAQKLLEATARIIHNKESRDRSTRDGQDLQNGGQPLTSGIITSEVMPTPGSGADRMLNVPLTGGQISLDTIIELDQMHRRRGRASLMSAFIQWLAGDLPKNLSDAAEIMRNHAAFLRAQGRADRLAESIGHQYSAWTMMLLFLSEAGAITTTERDQLLTRVTAALEDTADSTTDVDFATQPGQRILDSVRYALGSAGIGYVENIYQGGPPEPAIASRLGWRRSPMPNADTPEDVRWDPRGQRVGYLSYNEAEQRGELLLERSTLDAILKSAASSLTDALVMDERTAVKHLADEGILITGTRSGGSPRYTLSRRVPTEGADVRRRFVVIALDRLLATEHGDDTPPADPGGPSTPDLTPSTPAPQLPTPEPVAAPSANRPVPSSQPQPDDTRQETTRREPVRQSRIAPPAQAWPARKSKPAQVFTAAAAVLTADGLITADGATHPVGTIRHVGDLGDLVSEYRLGTQITDYLTEAGQIWITRDGADRLGIPLPNDADLSPHDANMAIKKLTEGHPMITGAADDGWKIGAGGASFGGWTTIWKDNQRAKLVLIPALDDELPILEDAPEPATLAHRLALFAAQLGMPWNISPAGTGIDLMTKLRWKDRDRLFTPHKPVPPAQMPTLETDINWTRKPTDDEQRFAYVHAYDRGGSYAAGIAGLELGIGEPEHHDQGRPFDKKLPGYWLVNLPEQADWRLPDPFDPRGILTPGEPTWVTTPTMDLAESLGYAPDILEAYTWTEHSRILNPWYERIRDARMTLDTDDPDSQAARELLKTVYTRSIGMMASHEYMKNRPGYAPDRQHMIIAKARANILRRIVQIGTDAGVWPLACSADTILYPSDNPDPIAAWPGKPEALGRKFGQFKHEGSAVLADQLPYLNGKRWRGKEHLQARIDGDN